MYTYIIYNIYYIYIYIYSWKIIKKIFVLHSLTNTFMPDVHKMVIYTVAAESTA